MRHEFSWMMTVAVTLLGVGYGWAQSDVRMAFAPVPVWPSDGLITPDLDDHYVFYDPSSEDAVIALTDPLMEAWDTDEELARPPVFARIGSRWVHRIRLNRGVRPSLDVNVQGINGQYTYFYALSNASDARQDIRLFRIYTQLTTGDIVVRSPGLWQGSVMSTQGGFDSGRAADYPFEPLTTAAGIFIDWFYSDTSSPIPPGAMRNGFEVSTSLKPGFTFALFEGGDFASAVPGLPEVVVEQLGRVLSPAFNAQHVFTIGPTHQPDATRVTIAANFHYGISRLIGDGVMDQNSPAVTEALAAVERYIGPNLATLFNMPLELSEAGTTPLERTIQQALVLSMR